MKMIGYKAFDKNFKCRDFEFEIGKEYEEEEAILCSKGFHFCENPLDTLNYYDLCGSKFAIVEVDDVSEETKQEDSKRCSKKIKIKTELSLKDFIKFSFEYLKEKCENKYDDKVLATSGKFSKVATSGDYSQVATSGYSSKVATSGNSSQVATSGEFSQVATSGGFSKVATSGEFSQVATSGYSSKVATSGDYSQVATSGYSSQVATSGDYSQVATSGEFSQVELKGKYSVGMCAGINSKIKGKIGNWITISEWEYSEKISAYIPICVKTCQIDGKEIKEDVFYKLEKGEFVEC